MLCYPSFHAILCHRISHWLWRVANLYLLARFISQVARFITGIEIHPGAKIGKNIFIDHGAAVVIGETSHIGDNVTLYHGATLGGINPSNNSDSQRNIKRHPTIGDNVVIASGAQILGPITIGKNARIGANAVVLRAVEENTTVVGVPARPVCKNNSQDFQSYAVHQDDPDPMQKIYKDLEKIYQEVQILKEDKCGKKRPRTGRDDDISR